MRLLVIALSGAGDVLMSTPLVKILKKNIRGIQIDYLVMQGKVTEEILEDFQEVDKIIYFNFMKEGYIKSLNFCKNLRKDKYDLSINIYPQARIEYSIISRLIGAKKRIGFRYSKIFCLNGLFLNRLFNEEFGVHVIENNLKILKEFNLSAEKINLHAPINNSSETFAKNFLVEKKIKKFIVIHAGSGETKNFIVKRWSKDKFAELAKILASLNFKILLVGGKQELNLNEEIIKSSGLIKNKQIYNLDTHIKNVASLIKRSRLVISNDTLIGHISASLNKDTISLFGPTDPRNTAPYGSKTRVINKRPKTIYPYRHGDNKISRRLAKTMDLIKTEDVLKEVNNILR